MRDGRREGWARLESTLQQWQLYPAARYRNNEIPLRYKSFGRADRTSEAQTTRVATTDDEDTSGNRRVTTNAWAWEQWAWEEWAWEK